MRNGKKKVPERERLNVEAQQKLQWEDKKPAGYLSVILILSGYKRSINSKAESFFEDRIKTNPVDWESSYLGLKILDSTKVSSLGRVCTAVNRLPVDAVGALNSFRQIATEAPSESRPNYKKGDEEECSWMSR